MQNERYRRTLIALLEERRHLDRNTKADLKEYEDCQGRIAQVVLGFERNAIVVGVTERGTMSATRAELLEMADQIDLYYCADNLPKWLNVYISRKQRRPMLSKPQLAAMLRRLAATHRPGFPWVGDLREKRRI